MTKVRKVKRRKTFKVDVNRKRLRNKMRKLPTITCPQIKEAWENTKSTKSNLVQMGLAYDANKILKIPSTKRELVRCAKRRAAGELSDSEEEQDVKKRIPKKHQVATALEAEARAPRERMFRLPNGQVQFLTYLMDKYDDDFKAMVRDKKNYNQLTWKQIRSKINTFKGIPEQYAEYLLKKGEIVLDDPTPLAETRKQIAEENVRKHCIPKKPKKKKPAVAQWIEESIEDEDPFETLDTLEDVEQGKTDSTEKKLKLFSDDESDGEDKKVEDKKTTKAKDKKNGKKIEKKESSDSEDSEELEGDEDGDFRDLSDLSEEELSDDDILDDGEFVTDSDEEKD